eukprot:12479311-Alexandrium_andersonii.AAC.1
MSASLVGSEMCIRDRAGRRFRRCAPGAPPFAQRPRPSELQLHGGPVAVSYTHLTLPTICSV